MDSVARAQTSHGWTDNGEKRYRILVVDDDATNRLLLGKMLAQLDFDVESAADGFEGLEKLRMGIDLVLLDVMMPGMDGYEVTRRMREQPAFEHIPIIIATGLRGKKEHLRALDAGANDFVTKPLDLVELKIRLSSQLRLKEALDTIKRHGQMLEETVARRTADLREALSRLAEEQRKTRQAQLETIHRLSVAAEYKDEDTGFHIQRMSQYAAVLAHTMGATPSEVELLLHTSPMHDVGKMGIPDSVLMKPGKLTPEEWDIMKQHTILGARMLGGSGSDFLNTAEIIALSHHEKWDGSGYPNGLAGEAIPRWGRICAVADVFDALTSERPYKKAFDNETAFRILKEGQGKHFEPAVIEAFFDNQSRILEIKKELRG